MAGQNILGGGINRSNVQRIVRTKAEGSNYIGAGDNLLDFGSSQSFLKEDNCGKIFSFNLHNVGETMPVALFAGNFDESSTYLDGAKIIKEGSVADSVTSAGTPAKIDALVAYLKANPSRLRAIKIKADDESQLDFPIILRHINPFKGKQDETRVPSQYQRSGDNNTKVIELTDINWILGADNILLTTIGAGRSVVVSLVFGASLDTEMGLMKKADEANINMANLGVVPQ